MLGAVDTGGRTWSESEKREPIAGVTGTFLRNSEIFLSAMPGSPIQEQIRAWMQIGSRKVAYLKKSQKNETSRPTFVSSIPGKPPKGGFLFLKMRGPFWPRAQLFTKNSVAMPKE